MADGMQQAGNLRKVLKKVITTEINRQRPDVRIGRVWSVDLGAQVAQVLFPGNTNLVPAHFGLDKIPTNTVLGNLDPSVDIESISDYNEVAGTTNADVVRVAGKPKDWFILDFIQGSPGKADSVFDDDLNSDIVFTQDYGIATGNTDTPIRLKYLPIGDSSVTVSWGGVRLHRSEWDFADGDPWTIIVPAQGFKADDEFEAHYAYTDPAPRPPTPASAMFVGSTVIDNNATSVALPTGTQNGDLLVLAMATGLLAGSVPSCADARISVQNIDAGNHLFTGYGFADATSDPLSISISDSEVNGKVVLATYRITGIVSHASSNGTSLLDPTMPAGSPGASVMVLAYAKSGSGLTTPQGGWIRDIEGHGSGTASEAWEAAGAPVLSISPAGVNQWRAIVIGLTGG